jgi:putative membrane protein
MQPQVHTILISLLDNPVSATVSTQALTLKNLFINQGFYNLFLVVGGIWGFLLVKRGKYAAGYALLLLFCFSATAAGIVLALSTKAYILAFLQCVPAFVLFLRILPLYNRASELHELSKYNLTGNGGD